ncbi:MAG: four-carbon acid sugar kinase family protein [Bacteroidales bacterium]
MNLIFKDIVSNQPAEYEGELLVESFNPDRTIIILDDDPTGCQTVSNVPLFFTWKKEVLTEAFKRKVPLLFILTNTRSLNECPARSLLSEVLENIKEAGRITAHEYIVISRSDSTLRGHYPMEPDIIAQHLELRDPLQCLIPAFFQGGRFTIDNVHYVKEGDQLIPASETQFAKDASFGFRNSDLRKYVEEKTFGKVKSHDVLAVSIEDLRQGGPENVYKKLIHSPKKVCIVNAISQKDLDVFAAASRKLINEKKDIVFRIAASFINSFADIAVAKLLNSHNIRKDHSKGILFIVGSYVKKSSDQLHDLLKNSQMKQFEINVEELVKDELEEDISGNISEQLNAGIDCILFTTRQLITGQNASENLKIGAMVSDYISRTIKSLEVPPSVIITKGGITSHIVARDGLEIEEAVVLGQILPGVPIIKPVHGKFKNTPQVIFPGNVGDTGSLTRVFSKLKGVPHE